MLFGKKRHSGRRLQKMDYAASALWGWRIGQAGYPGAQRYTQE